MFAWFPWNESRMPIPELYYACNRVLLWWVHYQKTPKIHLYCDGGSHRSVTVFGAFLLTYFKEDAEKIVANRTSLRRELATEDNSNPLTYIRTYLEDFPEDALLFKAMGSEYIGSLETHCNSIYERISKRYGKQQ